MKLKLSLVSALFGIVIGTTINAQEAVWPAQTHYRYEEVKGSTMFYREAGEQRDDKPTIVLLHGWPASSHYFRELIPLLSGRYHVIAPDNLGSGYSQGPDPLEVTYTFEMLAEHLAELLEKIGVEEYVFYVQDFGAPVGFRAMFYYPEKLKGIIAQNGNAYMEGLGEGVEDFFKEQNSYASPDFAENMGMYGIDVVKGVYLDNVNGQESIQSPDAWTHDWVVLGTRDGQIIQGHLAQDYVNNLADYPRWQKFFREKQPKVLSVWGGKDTFFISQGGEAFKKDVEDVTIHVMDHAGHFAPEEVPVEIAKHVINFMEEKF